MNARRLRFFAFGALFCALATSCILGPKQDDPASTSGPPGAGCCGDELAADTGGKTGSDAGSASDSAGGGGDVTSPKTDDGVADAAPFGDSAAGGDTSSATDSGISSIDGGSDGGIDSGIDSGSDGGADATPSDGDAGDGRGDADAGTDGIILDGDAITSDAGDVLGGG